MNNVFDLTVKQFAVSGTCSRCGGAGEILVKKSGGVQPDGSTIETVYKRKRCPSCNGSGKA